MRRTTRARPTGALASLQIAPLIDAVFLLLTYFLFTISLATVEGLLPSEVASGDQFAEQPLPVEQITKQLVIRIVRAGSGAAYFIDDWPMAGIAEVITRLEALGKDDIIVIDADAFIAYEHVVRLYNRALASGVVRVVFPLPANTTAHTAPRS